MLESNGNTVDGIIAVDERGIVKSVNPAVEAMFGCAAGDLVGGDVNLLIAQPDASVDSDFVSRHLTAGSGPQAVEGQHQGGEAFPLEMTTGELVLGGERLFLVVLRDLAGQRRSEQVLHQRSELIQLLQRTATDANSADKLAQAMRDTLADVCAYNGWPIAHAYVLSPDDENLLVSSGIWHLDDAERFSSFREVTEGATFERDVGLPGRVLASGRPDWIVDVTQDANFPRAELANDIGVKAGFACPVLVGSKVVAVLEFFAAQAIEPDQMLLGSLLQVGTQLGRVYEREWSGRVLHESAQELRDVLANVIQGVAMFDSDHRLAMWNDQYRHVLGFPEGFLQVGMPARQAVALLAEKGFFGDGDPERLTEERLELLWSGQVQRREVTVGGKVYDAASLPTPGGGAVITYTDITELKQAQARIEAHRDALEELNQQKTRLFSIIAHDLRNPFNSLLGNAEMMTRLGDKLSPEQLTANAEAIHESGRRLFDLLENLLEWARSQMDQVVFEPQSIDLDALVQRNIDLLRPAAEAKNIRLDTDVPPMAVRADSHMLDTVLRNLLGNAVKFSEEAGRVSVSARDEGAWIELKVADSGVGMAPDELKNLFQSEFTHSTEGTRGESGTGLGLLLCKDFVERHGGTIAAESSPGRGSTFRVRLPAG